MNIFIDIETIPDIEFKDDIAVSPPGNVSKPETIKLWEKGEGKYAGVKEAAIEKEFRKLSFDGTRGQIFCIAWCLGDCEIVCNSQAPGKIDEKVMLTNFLDALWHFMHEVDGRPIPLKWIGHYITGFDLRYIWQRCVINQVNPLVNIPYNAKPWSENVYDTCIEWKGSGSSSGSQDALCKAFGLEGKGEMDGSKVYDEYLAGNYQKIVDYCKDDVEKVRELYKRMTFGV